ncbi:DUF2997 domain-containing protein [Microbacterium sp. M3]|uniref:DUF2997 domain-containing protein n=1 Tax=Microbacterium arthrosphaerae TaxID=792652 RepID=A0ABU4H9H6_9MICO|nr:MULTISPECIES: DUF2997 domain-containing protein [Microbacterium]MDW4574534.1 DUF2997 domain-containing protein [Microbacterium arthrosphaerae]MDW7608389.1 DUF2997 domain-containing protein [Microbacterium sp. M3]
MAKQLVVRLRADGTVDAETIGMHGPECLDHIEALEALLDAETVSSRFTEDYTTASVAGTTEVETEQSDRTR